MPEDKRNSAALKWWDREADVVIAGGSYAGLAAAVGACEKGADVIVLEEAKDSLRPVGRDGRGFVGLFAVESSLQRKEGIELTRDWAFSYAVELAHWRCNIPLLRMIIDGSSNLVDWLMQQGVTFTGVGKIIPHYPRVWHYFGDQSLEVVRVLVGRAGERGVKLLYRTRAKDLIISPEGRVIGVRAFSEGNLLRIKARAVILATGNTDYFTRLEPGAPDPDKPDGVRMARTAGAAIDCIEQYTYGFGVVKEMPPEFDELARVPEQPLLFINKSGKRVFNEAYTYQPEMINVAEFQKDRTLIQVFDDSSKKNMMTSGVKFLQHGTRSQKLTRLNEQIEAGIPRGLIERAPTLRELAGRLMVPADSLEATVERYNRCCDGKHDDIFMKSPEYLEPVREPPFYAIVCDQQFGSGGPPGARKSSGVRINNNCQALDSNNNPIPGLYTAGKDAAGIYGSIYPLQLAGLNMTFEIDTGRIAGEHAASAA